MQSQEWMHSIVYYFSFFLSFFLSFWLSVILFFLLSVILSFLSSPFISVSSFFCNLFFFSSVFSRFYSMPSSIPSFIAALSLFLFLHFSVFPSFLLLAFLCPAAPLHFPLHFYLQIWDYSNYLVDLSGFYANCEGAGEAVSEKIEKHTAEGQTIQAVVDFTHGEEAHVNAVNEYITEVIDRWVISRQYDGEVSCRQIGDLMSVWHAGGLYTDRLVGDLMSVRLGKLYTDRLIGDLMSVWHAGKLYTDRLVGDLMSVWYASKLYTDRLIGDLMSVWYGGKLYTDRLIGDLMSVRLE